MKLFFDTETTGLVDFNRLPGDECQPRVVQLAAVLTEDEGKEVDCFNVLIKPEGFEIPKEATAVHGISTEQATLNGIMLVAALDAFSKMAVQVNMFGGHNIAFDHFILLGEYERRHLPSPFGSIRRFCTMEAMTPFCKIPSRYGFKWPKLQEAHVHAFGHEFAKAHDALADVRATASLYFWLRKRGVK